MIGMLSSRDESKVHGPAFLAPTDPTPRTLHPGVSGSCSLSHKIQMSMQSGTTRNRQLAPTSAEDLTDSRLDSERLLGSADTSTSTCFIHAKKSGGADFNITDIRPKSRTFHACFSCLASRSLTIEQQSIVGVDVPGPVQLEEGLQDTQVMSARTVICRRNLDG